jgi:AcrR family transcriptional regulator
MTRDEILDASAQIFSLKGYHGTSMQDIAAAVNLQKASVYHHVSSKQQILFELLNRGLQILTGKVEDAIAKPGPPEDQLRKAIQSYLIALTENQELTSVLLLEYRSLEPEYLVRHVKERDRFEQIWRDLIQSGVDQGAFECEHPSMSARALLGVMNWTVTWFRYDGPMSAGEIADQITDLFLYGLSQNTQKFEVEGRLWKK